MRLYFALIFVLLVSIPALAEDWPGWLGPRRDGTSAETIPVWKGNPEVLWRTKVGPGHSSPVVAGGVIYLHTQVKGTEEEQVSAFDAKTGKVQWTTKYARTKFSSPFGTGPQATPIVHQGKIYSFGATGILACFDKVSGDLDWKVETQSTFKAPPLFFGAACSPLIDGNHVLVNVGGKGASVVAFEQKTGKVAWKSLDDKASYSSGVVIGKEDKREVVFLTQQGLRGFNPTSGKKLWDFPLVDRLNESSTTPVVAGDLILASSITYGMVGLKLGTNDDGTQKVNQVWKNPKLTCYFSTPIPVGKKHVYLVTGVLGFRPTSTLHCIESDTGKILWSRSNIGKYHAALLKLSDKKFLMLSDVGDLVCFEANPEKYVELARTKIVRGEQIWAHPALSDGIVYFRDEKELICVKLK